MSSTNSGIANNRILITRTTVVLGLFFTAWRAYCHDLVPQLEHPVLFRSGYNLSYWLTRCCGADQWLLQRPARAWTLIGILCGSGLLLLWRPRRRLWAFLFAISYLFHTIIFNLYLCQTSHVQAGFVMLFWSFCASSDERFAQWWRVMRYYVCYIFFTAFLWKLNYGSLWHWRDGELFFREHAAPYLFWHPHTSLAGLYRYLLQHPVWLNAGEKMIFLCQGLFVTGFFTRNYDRAFIVFLLSFILLLAVLGHHFFIEFIVLILPLMRPGDWERLKRTDIQAVNYSTT